jgi:hypothetical protein
MAVQTRSKSREPATKVQIDKLLQTITKQDIKKKANCSESNHKLNEQDVKQLFLRFES